MKYAQKKKSSDKWIIGIDEVGRGPLAGPVVVCALALPIQLKIESERRKIKDSKQLTAAQRERWFAWIKENKIFYAIARATPKMIDRINITQAANRAAHQAYKKLNLQIHQNSIALYGSIHESPPSLIIGSPPSIIMDGGLCLPQYIPHRVIVKADEKYPAVALASIIAKVTRDRSMAREHKQYPQYGFAKNKGYGTAVHIQAIKKYGPCPLHRLTFIQNVYTIK